jgi:solute carrier family 12 (potassium/chloride transporters), member 9
MGVALLHQHPEAALGHERRINVWVSDRSPNWQLGLRLVNLDLSLLLGYQLYRNWRGPLRLLTVCREPSEMENGRNFLNQLIDDARLPHHTECYVYQGMLLEHIREAPQADLNIFGLARQVDKAFLETLVRRSSSSCLFVRDSGRESALA